MSNHPEDPFRDPQAVELSFVVPATELTVGSSDDQQSRIRELIGELDEKKEIIEF